MNKTILGVAMVVVFCITWWLVAGEAMQAVEPAKQAYEQALQANLQALKAYEQEDQADTQAPQGYFEALQAQEQALQAWKQAKQAYLQAQRALEQAKQASIMADAHWRTQRSWGIGTGLLADVLLLVGALAWSKLTAKA